MKTMVLLVPSDVPLRAISFFSFIWGMSGGLFVEARAVAVQQRQLSGQQHQSEVVLCPWYPPQFLELLTLTPTTAFTTE
jgi:hypothetical protein